MPAPYSNLTPLELQILKLYNKDTDEYEIAEILHIDINVVEDTIDRLDELGFL